MGLKVVECGCAEGTQMCPMGLAGSTINRSRRMIHRAQGSKGDAVAEASIARAMTGSERPQGTVRRCREGSGGALIVPEAVSFDDESTVVDLSVREYGGTTVHLQPGSCLRFNVRLGLQRRVVRIFLLEVVNIIALDSDVYSEAFRRCRRSQSEEDM